MHFARREKDAEHGQRRDDQDDQLDRRLQPEGPRERDDQKIDSQIADQRPAELEIALQFGRRGQVELDTIARNMPRHVDQGRNFGP